MKNKKKLKASVCIIGGGVAGLTIAKEIARANDCIIIEVGSNGALGDRTNLKWYVEERDYTEIKGDKTYRPELSWVKILGGGCEAWEGYTPRMVENDFKLKTNFNVARDWPISYQELESYYAEAERFLGVSGCADNPSDSFRSSSFPLPPFEFDIYEREITSRVPYLNWHHVPQARNSLPYYGRMACNNIGTCNQCPTQARWSPSAQLLPEIYLHPRINLMTETQAVELIVDEDNLVTRVKVFSKKEGFFYIETERVILSAGNVETVRLLLTSTNTKNKNGLLNNNGLLGKGFMDHPALRITAEVPWGFKSQLQTNILASCHDYRKYDIETGAWGFLINLNSRKRGKLWVAAHMEMPPEDSNSITLSQDKKDYLGRPFASVKVAADWSGYSQTKRKIIQVLENICASVGGVNSSIDPLQLWACHPMGGTPMSTCEESGVVDQNLMAWESKNIYILSLGVFPTGAAVNPTLTLLALTFRLRDHILRNDNRPIEL